MKTTRFGLALAMGSLVSALGPVGVAMAGTDTATLGVSVTVEESCGINGSSLNFGTYTSGQTDALDADASLSFTSCPAGQLSFALDGGQSGDPAARAMTDGSSGSMSYQLYKNASRTQVWGDGADANDVVVLVPGSGTVPVYGRIPGSQTVGAGSYADTINITMTF